MLTMSSETPIIKPIKLTEYQTKQSKYPMVGKLPTRSLLVGPSGSGKGIILSNMIIVHSSNKSTNIILSIIIT